MTTHHGHPPARWLSTLPLVLAGATVLTQITYPLVDGSALRWLTLAVVVLFVCASLTHVASYQGTRTMLTLLVIAAGVGFIAEAVGVRAGFPFGRYEYSRGLGPQLLGVPLIVPMAWTMMAYPCLLLGRRLASVLCDAPAAAVASRVLVMGCGAWALASWDLFLDPQMVAAGHWIWANPTPGLPGVPGIPLTNYAGWLLVSVVMIGLLDRAVPTIDTETVYRRSPKTRSASTTRITATSTDSATVPTVLLGWTWAGSTVGNLMFFGRPAVALWGGIAMGIVVLPYLLLFGKGHRVRHPSNTTDHQASRSGAR